MRALAALLAAALLGASACSSSGHASSRSGGPSITVSSTRALTGNELTYGPTVGATPGVVYQPDVVLIGGGANAVVAADSSGLVWTIKGTAPGASRLTVGKIMAATSLSTGRVLALKHLPGGDIQVVLGPVSLTDVFYHLDIGSAPGGIPLDHPTSYSYPDSPVQTTDPGSAVDAGPDAAPSSVAPTAPKAQSFLQPADAASPSTGKTTPLPKPKSQPDPVTEGQFTLTPYCCSPSQGVRIAYSTAAGRMGANVGLVMSSKPLLEFHVTIDGGGLQEAVFKVHGPQAIEFEFDAATTNVSGNYKSPTLRIPTSIMFALGVVPITVTLTQQIYGSIQLAGQAAFSTKGEYKISGAVLGFSYSDGQVGVETPTISTELSALKNATSLAVGINALTLGYGARLSAGIGVLGFNAGPYLDLGASLAIDKDGSPPQTSLKAGCATAAVYVQGSYGIGYEIPNVVAKFVNEFLKLFNATPIAASGGKNWGPYTIWNPGKAQLCLKR